MLAVGLHPRVRSGASGTRYTATGSLPMVPGRSANLRLQGNGQDAVSPAGYLAELPSLVDEMASGAVGFAVDAAPLADVSEVWSRPTEPGARTVLIP